MIPTVNIFPEVEPPSKLSALRDEFAKIILPKIIEQAKGQMPQPTGDEISKAVWGLADQIMKARTK